MIGFDTFAKKSLRHVSLIEMEIATAQAQSTVVGLSFMSFQSRTDVRIQHNIYSLSHLCALVMMNVCQV